MNSFDTSIARALEKGWKDGARRMRMEKKMASGLIKACLRRGYFVTIDNGEDKPIVQSKNYRKIMNQLWQTDEEHVLIYDSVGKYLGWFFLVYGNDGWDLISDFSDNAACAAIWDEDMQPLADRVESGA